MMIRSPFLPLLFDWMHANGSGPIVDVIRAELDLPETGGSLVKEMTVPHSVFVRASELAAERQADDFLGLHLAAHRARGSYGILEHAARNAPNVGEALSRIAEYLHLVSDTTRVELPPSESEFALVHSLPDEPSCIGRHANEFVLGAIHRLVRDATGKPIAAVCVEFAHAAPAQRSELEQFFGTENLLFDQGRNRLVYAPETRQSPMVVADGQLLPWLDGLARDLAPPGSTLTQRLEGLHDQIRACLREKAPATLAEVARRMNASTRTLQRRLQEACTSFQRELEQVRRELAESYLSTTKASIYEIALLLGYADRSGFERIFGRQHGMTPGEFRRLHSGAWTSKPSASVGESVGSSSC